VSSGAPSPSYPTPNNGGKGKGKGKGKNNGSGNKNRGNNTLTWLSFYKSLDRHQIDLVRDVPSSAVGVSTAAHPACCTGVLRRPWRPFLRALAVASTALAASRDPYLVTLDECVGSPVIWQLLQHHGLDSPDGHRLGHRLRRLQPHHLGC
jgi:hypothetical protein